MNADTKLVLLVEDDPTLCQSLAECLQDEGYQVVSTVDGRDALDWLTRSGRSPHVIITDLLMPRMDGWELWTQLRATSRWKTIPVFVLSSATSLRPWPAGAAPAQQLRKPPDLNHLLHLLSKLTGEPTAVASC